MLPTQNNTESASPRSKLSVFQIGITVVAAWTTYAMGVHLTLNAQTTNSDLNSIWSVTRAELHTGLTSISTTRTSGFETRLSDNWVAPMNSETSLRR